MTPTWIGITGITAIAAGGYSTYALKTDGTVLAWGTNSVGQLGDGSATDRHIPVPVSSLTNIIAIAAGTNHALALKSDGTLWAWGYNNYGQIGDNTTTTHFTPVQLSSLGTSVQAIGAAGDHSHVAKIDGTVWSWGRNLSNEAGDGTVTSPRKTPVQTGTIANAISIDGGAHNGFAWDASGSLSAWGWNGEGELGDGTTISKATPVGIPSLSAVLSLHGGVGHTVVTKTDGSVWTMGYNGYGQIGDGTTTNRATPIHVSALDSIVSAWAGDYFSVAVSSDGRVWSWGANYDGQLGDGTDVSRHAPVQLSDPGFSWRVVTPTLTPSGGSFTANVTVTVACATAGATIHYTTNGVDPIESDLTIASGSTLAVTQTTTLKARAWLAGMTTSPVTSATYNLKVVAPTFSPGGTTYAAAQSVTVSTSTSAATIRYTTDGTVPTEGSPVYASPISVTTGTTLKAIAIKTGWTTSAPTTATYTFNYGTLAAPVFSPVPGQVADGTSVTISAAPSATIRFTTNGTTPTASSTIYTGPITVGAAITINAKAFEPDWTTSPMSGGAYTLKVASPVFSPDAGSYAPGQLVTMTDVTPNAVIRYTTNGVDPTGTDPVIPSGSTVVAGNYALKAQAFLTGWTSSDIKTAAYALTEPFTNWATSPGALHSVALKSDGTVWTWGANTGGALGDASAGRSTAAMVNGVTGVVAIAAGDSHSLALRSEGTVWAWGTNSNGQLGDNTATSRSMFAAVTSLSSVTAIAAGSTFSVALKSDGTVWTWGNNGSGQLGDGTLLQRNLPTQVPGLTGVVAISAGDRFTLARKGDGSVWAWGDNSYGQLGDGSTVSRRTPVQVLGLTASAGPWAGYTHAFAASSTGALYAWGSNIDGELGTGGGGSTTPVLVTSLANVTPFDGTGYNFSIARASDGSAWTWGSNTYGQLGDGTTTSRATPSQVAGVTDVAAVGAGTTQSVIIKTDGSVWTWGYNYWGELGDGTVNDRWLPVRISEANFNWKTSTPRLAPYSGTYSTPTSVTVTAVTPGAEIHYTTNGSDPTQSDALIASGSSVVVDQTATLKVRAWSAGMPESNVASAAFTIMVPVPNVSLASGTYLSDQSVTMSSSVPGTTIRYTVDGTDPTPASTAYANAITVDVSTTVKAKAFKTGWTDSDIVERVYTLQVTAVAFSPADGMYGTAQSLSLSTTTPSATIYYTQDGSQPLLSSPIYTGAVTIDHMQVVRAFAAKAGWTASDVRVATYWLPATSTLTAPIITPGTGTYESERIVNITADAGTTVRYTTDGTEPTELSPAYAHAPEIVDTTTIKAKAFKASYAASATTTATLTIASAGGTAAPTLSPPGGQFTTQQVVTVTGPPGATVRYTTSGVDPTATDPVIASGGTVTINRSLVLKIRAWQDGLAPSRVHRGDYIITGAIGAGEHYSMALKGDGTVWTWGDNFFNQIGDGTTAQRNSPYPVLSNAIAIAAGMRHALAVTADGTVWAWGENAAGEVGDGTTARRTTPYHISTLTNVVAVAAGFSDSYAVTSDGTVWAWGSNGAGQLGDGTTTNRLTPSQVPGLSGIRAIAAGEGFALALVTNGAAAGTVWAWGSNAYGQLGDGATTNRLTPEALPSATNVTAIFASGGQRWAMARTAANELLLWGVNDNGQMGNGVVGGANQLIPTRTAPWTGPPAALGGGLYHPLIVATDGTLWGWGNNAYAQLAAPASSPVISVERIAAFPLAMMAVGSARHTLAVTEDGQLWTWGNGALGQLGTGTTTSSTVPVALPAFSLVDNSWLTGDPDLDGLSTWREYQLGTDPLSADTDGDGIPDGVTALGTTAPNLDPDGDRVPTALEMLRGTDPFNPDTDGDGVPDGVDCFPLDPTRSACVPFDPNDHTPPVITLTEPIHAVRIP